MELNIALYIGAGTMPCIAMPDMVFHKYVQNFLVEPKKVQRNVVNCNENVW